MSSALLLITQQRQRRKNSKPQPQYVHACVIRRHVQQYVCVHIAEDAGSSAGKVNWALCWVKAYSAQTKGPIKKKKKKPVTGSWKAKHWAMVRRLPRSLRSAAWMITNDDFKRAHDSRSWVRLFPLQEQDGWWDDIGRLRTPRRLVAMQSVHNTRTPSCTKLLSGMLFYQQRGKCQLPRLM